MKGYKNTYTKSAYSRSAMIRRDFVYEAIVAPKCQICEKTIERKNTKNGYPETMRVWLRKKTCGYLFENGKLILSECAKRWRKIPQNNGRYKGIMDIPCKICGKTKLSYRLSSEKYGLCRTCWDKNRPTAYNKKETKLVSCIGCGKQISNRWKNGKLRREKAFCSKICANRSHRVYPQL